MSAYRYDNALHMMEAVGGSFVRSLAACYYAADIENKLRLRAAFKDYFVAYERQFEDGRAKWQAIERAAEAGDADAMRKAEKLAEARLGLA